MKCSFNTYHVEIVRDILYASNNETEKVYVSQPLASFQDLRKGPR